MSDRYWVGVKATKNEVFEDKNPDEVTSEKYPEYEYCVGPFSEKKRADDYAARHTNVDGTFTDPFCNGGQGR